MGIGLLNFLIGKPGLNVFYQFIGLGHSPDEHAIIVYFCGHKINARKYRLIHGNDGEIVSEGYHPEARIYKWFFKNAGG